MGYYINENSKGQPLQPWHKAQQLVKDGAVVVPQPTELVDDLVCVVSNPTFDAAAYVHDQREFSDFTDPSDDRPKVWLRYEHAARLSGYEKT